MAKYVNSNELSIPAIGIKFQVCIFCLKRIPIVKSELENDFSSNWQNFLKFWTRFVDRDIKLEKQFESNLDNRACNCCDDCLIITTSFCEMYHQLKILEMSLEWKLDSLLNTVKLANEIPSRIREMREIFEQGCHLSVDNEGNEKFIAKNAETQIHEYKVFRHLLTKESKRKLDQSKPRLLITSWDQKTPIDNNIIVKDEIVNDEVTFDEPFQQENDKDSCTAESTIVERSILYRENVIDVVMGIQIVKEEVLEDVDVTVTGLSEDIHNESFQSENSMAQQTTRDSNLGKGTLGFCPQDKKMIKYNNNLEHQKAQEMNQDNQLEQESEESKTQNFESSNLNEQFLEKIAQTKNALMCANCPGYFYKQDVFDEHQKLHASGTFKCQFCDKMLTSVYKLGQHESQDHAAIYSQSNPKELHPVACARCPYKTVQPLLYYEHFAEVHFGVFDSWIGRGYINCSVCKIQTSQNQHFKRYHDTTNVRPDEIEQCKEENCSAFFVTTDGSYLRAMNKHIEYHHRIWKLEDEAKEQLAKFRRKAFTCKRCNMLHCSQSELEVHMLQSHKIICKRSKSTHFSCPRAQCNETFHTSENLRVHKTHHGTFSCRLCNKQMTYAPDLATHEANEHYHYQTEDDPEDIFRCARCNYKYISKPSYIRHFLEKHLHLETTGYFCIICQNKFACEENLKMHVNIIHKMELEDLMKTESMFQCNVCPESFAKSEEFVNHQNQVHLKNKNCPLCQKHFNNHKDLRVHFKKLHPKNNINMSLLLRYQCSICHNRFSDSWVFNRHKKICLQKHRNKRNR